MSNYNQNESRELEDTLLKVKFNKEINDLYKSIEEGMELQDSMLLNIIIDPSEDRENIFRVLEVKDIDELNFKMSQDRIFKRIIKLLEEKDLTWEIRQNFLREKTIRGYMLQLKILLKK